MKKVYVKPAKKLPYTAILRITGKSRRYPAPGDQAPYSLRTATWNAHIARIIHSARKATEGSPERSRGTNLKKQGPKN